MRWCHSPTAEEARHPAGLWREHCLHRAPLTSSCSGGLADVLGPGCQCSQSRPHRAQVWLSRRVDNATAPQRSWPGCATYDLDHGPDMAESRAMRRDVDTRDGINRRGEDYCRRQLGTIHPGATDASNFRGAWLVRLNSSNMHRQRHGRRTGPSAEDLSPCASRVQSSNGRARRNGLGCRVCGGLGTNLEGLQNEGDMSSRAGRARQRLSRSRTCLTFRVLRPLYEPALQRSQR